MDLFSTHEQSILPGLVLENLHGTETAFLPFAALGKTEKFGALREQNFLFFLAWEGEERERKDGNGVE